MNIKFRNNCDILNFGADYVRIRQFLLELNNPNYLFGRWDWMVTHRGLDKTGLSKIGLWEDSGSIAAMAAYDCDLGNSYFCVKPHYEFLKKEMLLYSKDNLSKDGHFLALINDSDVYFQDIASQLGFIATDSREHDAVYCITNADNIKYALPEGYYMTSLKNDYNYHKYRKVMWKGFNHELNGEGSFDPDKIKPESEQEMLRPNINLDLKLAIVAPNGDFVSYCGMWKDPSSEYALVEPVATDPDYRKLGLGKAVVLEGVKRCGLLGAKKAFVNSRQQFYYSIGFRPYATSTWWKEK